MSAVADEVSAACQRLLHAYDTEGWWPARSRFEVVVGAVLVQNTRWANVTGAIKTLRTRRLLNPAAIMAASGQQIQAAIRSAGCQRIKARRLQAVACGLHAAGGLNVMGRWDTERLRDYLLGLYGIGDETADAILAFAFGRRVFVADAYARRWLMRMGLWQPHTANTSYRRCRSMIEAQLDWEAHRLRDLHAAIVLHAQRACGRQPDCADCPLRPCCRFAMLQSADSPVLQTGASML